MAHPVNSTPRPQRQPGPVTLAIAAVRNELEPEAPRDPIAALRAGLERFFLSAGKPVDFDAEIPVSNQGGPL